MISLICFHKITIKIVLTNLDLCKLPKSYLKTRYEDKSRKLNFRKAPNQMATRNHLLFSNHPCNWHALNKVYITIKNMDLRLEATKEKLSQCKTVSSSCSWWQLTSMAMGHCLTQKSFSYMNTKPLSKICWDQLKI